jgi:hypothetical protein
MMMIVLVGFVRRTGPPKVRAPLRRGIGGQEGECRSERTAADRSPGVDNGKTVNVGS